MPETAMLEISGLNAWYGESHILHGVDFDVHEGEVVTLLGRNGAGKTTTMKSIMGIVGRREGSVKFKGTETIDQMPNLIARAGIAFCICSGATPRSLAMTSRSSRASGSG